MSRDNNRQDTKDVNGAFACCVKGWNAICMSLPIILQNGIQQRQSDTIATEIRKAVVPDSVEILQNYTT